MVGRERDSELVNTPALRSMPGPENRSIDLNRRSGFGFDSA
jgi:hypothetical protein